MDRVKFDAKCKAIREKHLKKIDAEHAIRNAKPTSTMQAPVVHSRSACGPVVQMPTTSTLRLYFDGSCNPNPGGTPRFGWYIINDGGELVASEVGSVMDIPDAAKTNNTAEWAGLLGGIRWLRDHAVVIDALEIFGDSRLVIGQYQGAVKCKKPHLKWFRDQCREITGKLDVGHVKAKWIPRGRNQWADELSKFKIDK